MKPLVGWCLGMFRLLVERALRVLLGPRRRAALAQWRQARSQELSLVRHVWQDARRFRRAAALGEVARESAHRRALITMDYHRLEKALSLREPRVGFGKQVAERLVRRIADHVPCEGWDQPARVGVRVLHAYEAFHAGHGAPDPVLGAAIAGLRAADEPGDQDQFGGIVTLDRAAITAAAPAEPETFFETRHSIRQFAATPIPASDITRALAMAQRTPSVCNRQAWRVRVIEDAALRARVLACQNGNRGFGVHASHVLVLTVDLRAFVSVGERHQGWIDGGMFAMSVVYALHALGHGTCCLNWSVEAPADAALRAVLDIPAHEVVTMLMVAGTLPDTLAVAQSPRLPLDAIWLPVAATPEVA